ncbi:NAD(P)-binding protein [Dendrothele bispora CBS 962.96]|uniref:NAD(P)-binding protein n=1 Tax=Dendrothele bispora (strain CBS 962.96) TaxID=1314807 RepID=A0A4S8LYP8_DENBC|nr:NAD(P)-binding protein [Dendrothele bispora CBS 962.96]
MPSILDSKCILVTGATAGIGRALALEIAKLPSKPKVIGSGRRQDRLDQLSEAGIEGMQLDVNADRETLKKFVDNLVNKNPDLDTIVLCAGIQRQFNFQKEVDLDAISLEFNVNYFSVVTTITYLIPHFVRLAATGRKCSIITVTSALSVIPMPLVPNYCATKAALHSYTMSLRAQLQSANIHVAEIVPPLVESELHDAEGTTERLSKFWMPLDEFTNTVMEGLKKGDTVVAAGNAKTHYEQFEQPKEAIFAQTTKALLQNLN